MTVIDLFAGPGGWDEGLRRLGRGDLVGIEHDRWACATRAAAWHRTVRADVATWPTDHLPRIDGLIASPPCQTFSQSGNRSGAAELDHLTDHIAAVARAGRWTAPTHPWADPRTPLVLEPVRWAFTLRPRWIALEQVPGVLPIWERTAWALRTLGYHAWTGILNAADYGVPQTRRRAILVAHRDRRVGPPPPTHTERPTASLFDTLLPWVTMADALGWAPATWEWDRTDGRGNRLTTGAPAPTMCGARQPGWTPPPRATITLRTGNNSMVTGRTGSRAGDGDVQPYERAADRPAPTVDGKAGSAWAFVRPATAVWNDAVKLTVAQALTLQGFRPDYPVQGNKTQRFRQIGDAVPPPLAAAILEVLT